MTSTNPLEPPPSSSSTDNIVSNTSSINNITNKTQPKPQRKQRISKSSNATTTTTTTSTQDTTTSTTIPAKRRANTNSANSKKKNAKSERRSPPTVPPLSFYIYPSEDEDEEFEYDGLDKDIIEEAADTTSPSSPSTTTTTTATTSDTTTTTTTEKTKKQPFTPPPLLADGYNTYAFLGFSGDHDPHLMQYYHFDKETKVAKFLSYGMRQVYSDPSFPLHFLQFRDDRTESVKLEIKRQQERVAELTKGLDERLVSIFFRFIYPTYPIVDRCQFIHDFQTNRNNIDVCLLSGLYAISILWWKYDKDDLCQKPIPQNLYEKLFDECQIAAQRSLKFPTLGTLQGLLLLAQKKIPRTDIAATFSSTIDISTIVSLAHRFGLHLDCSNWSISVAEKKLRKRLWAVVYLVEKWNSANLGTPSLISSDANTTWGEYNESAKHLQLFVQLCKLTHLLDDLVREFYSVRTYTTIFSPENVQGTLKKVDSYLTRLNDWREQLPPNMKDTNHFEPGEPSKNGILHLAEITVAALLLRLKLHPICTGLLDYETVAKYRGQARILMARISHYTSLIQHSHLYSFWHSMVRLNFCTLASFGLLFNVTSTTSKEYHDSETLFQKWIYTLKQLSHSWESGVGMATIKINAIFYFTNTILQDRNPSKEPIEEALPRLLKFHNPYESERNDDNKSDDENESVKEEDSDNNNNKKKQKRLKLIRYNKYTDEMYSKVIEQTNAMKEKREMQAKRALELQKQQQRERQQREKEEAKKRLQMEREQQRANNKRKNNNTFSVNQRNTANNSNNNNNNNSNEIRTWNQSSTVTSPKNATTNAPVLQINKAQSNVQSGFSSSSGPSTTSNSSIPQNSIPMSNNNNNNNSNDGNNDGNANENISDKITNNSQSQQQAKPNNDTNNMNLNMLKALAMSDMIDFNQEHSDYISKSPTSLNDTKDNNVLHSPDDQHQEQQDSSSPSTETYKQYLRRRVQSPTFIRRPLLSGDSFEGSPPQSSSSNDQHINGTFWMMNKFNAKNMVNFVHSLVEEASLSPHSTGPSDDHHNHHENNNKNNDDSSSPPIDKTNSSAMISKNLQRRIINSLEDNGPFRQHSKDDDNNRNENESLDFDGNYSTLFMDVFHKSKGESSSSNNMANNSKFFNGIHSNDDIDDSNTSQENKNHNNNNHRNGNNAFSDEEELKSFINNLSRHPSFSGLSDILLGNYSEYANNNASSPSSNFNSNNYGSSSTNNNNGETINTTNKYLNSLGNGSLTNFMNSSSSSNHSNNMYNDFNQNSGDLDSSESNSNNNNSSIMDRRRQLSISLSSLQEIFSNNIMTNNNNNNNDDNNNNSNNNLSNQQFVQNFLSSALLNSAANSPSSFNNNNNSNHQNNDDDDENGGAQDDQSMTNEFINNVLMNLSNHHY